MKFSKVISSVSISVVIVLGCLVVFSAFPFPGNYKIYTVLSGSMEPEIRTGSIVIAKPSDDYKAGDIITFRKSGKENVVTHRISLKTKEGGEDFYQTKGDANQSPDQEEVPKLMVVGKVRLSIPFLGYAVNFTQSPIGFALVIWIPATIIIWEEIGKIRKNIKKKELKEEQKNQ